MKLKWALYESERKKSLWALYVSVCMLALCVRVACDGCEWQCLSFVAVGSTYELLLSICLTHLKVS